MQVFFILNFCRLGVFIKISATFFDGVQLLILLDFQLARNHDYFNSVINVAFGILTDARNLFDYERSLICSEIIFPTTYVLYLITERSPISSGITTVICMRICRSLALTRMNHFWREAYSSFHILVITLSTLPHSSSFMTIRLIHDGTSTSSTISLNVVPE